MTRRPLQRIETTDAPAMLAAAVDPAARLEPLAVPMGRLISILRRHLWVVLLCPTLAVSTATIVLKRMPKQFTAEAALVIEPQRTQVSDLQAISPELGDTAGMMRTQTDILRSQALNLRVVQALNLTQAPEFTPKGGGVLATIKHLAQRLGLMPTPPAVPATLEELEQTAAGILSGKVAFVNEARSSVLLVAVTTQSPKLSADIANEIGEVFLDFKRQEKFTAMQHAHDWLQEQLGSLAEQLLAADHAVEQYRQQHQLDDLPPDDGTDAHAASVNRRQLDIVSAQLADATRDRTLKEGELAQAQAVIRGEAPANQLPAVLTSPAINALLTQTSAAAAREAELASSQGSGNPELVAARAQLRQLQRRMQQEMTNVAGSFTTEVATARAQEQAVRTQLQHMRGAVSNENTALVGLRDLQTKARATRNIYDSFLLRATQLANVVGIQQPDASLVSGARPPLGPSGPKIVRLVAVAGFVSVLFGVGIACAFERLRSGFSLPEDLEAVTELPLLGMMPLVPRKALHTPRVGKAGIALSAAFDNLRGQMRMSGEARPKVVMVTSSLPQEGKSMFAAGLAQNAAAAGWRVILIECDFFHPVLASYFGFDPTAGLSEVLMGNLLGDSTKVVHEAGRHLHVIPGGRMEGDPQELLASPRMAALLAEARSRYDLVVLDTPPVLPVPDALVLARQADATIMVIHWEKTPRLAVQAAVRRLRESRGHIMGTIMTRVNMSTAVNAAGRMPYSFNHSYYAARDRNA